MKTHITLAPLRIAMQCDRRLPRNAMGYVADLRDDALPEIVEDRLTQLARHIPDLVRQYRAALQS
jgi:hypothetical protein